MAKTRREKFDFEAFHSAVKKRDFAPIYFFYGEEDFLIDECVQAILETAVEPSMKEFNLDILQGSDVDGKRLLGMITAYPMMADRRVVVVKDFDKVPGKDLLESYAEHPSPTTVLVITAPSLDLRKKPYPALKKHAVTGEFKSLYDYDTIAWIETRFKKLKRIVDQPAIALLHSYVGNSLRELSNEIEKLIVSVGDQDRITEQNVKTVVGVTKEFSAFELANSIGEKNISKAFEISERLLGSGQNIVPIVAALTSHFVKVWKVQDGIRQHKSEAELAQIAGVHPFFLKAYIAQARNYSLPEIENIFVVLAETDLSAKTSGNPRMLLTKAISAIIRPARQTPTATFA
jgi:DNA polymerase-3 subunit delta